MAKRKVIELGGNKYNAELLRSVTEQHAVAALRHKYDPNQIRNAWKQANGLSVRAYSKDEEAQADKPKRKRTTKPKNESNSQDDK